MAGLSPEEHETLEALLRRSSPDDQSFRAFVIAAMSGRRSASELEQSGRDWGKAALAVAHVAPKGWAPTSVPVAGYARLYPEMTTWSDERIDAELVNVWKASSVVDTARARIRAVGACLGQDWITRYDERISIYNEAVRAAEAGMLRAAVSLLLGQVDGICLDVTGGQVFFSSGNQANLVDAVSFPGFEQGLEATRDRLSKRRTTTALRTDLSRHGVAHGRDLSYGTEVSYCKALVLVRSTAEWGLRQVNERKERERQERELKFEGSDERDRHGVRMDKRGFFEARDRLRRLHMMQLATRNTHGRFADLNGLVGLSAWLDDAQLEHIELTVADDGSWWYAWTQSTRGYYFAIGSTGDTESCHYEGEHPPAAPPPSTLWQDHETPSWAARIT